MCACWAMLYISLHIWRFNLTYVNQFKRICQHTINIWIEYVNICWSHVYISWLHMSKHILPFDLHMHKFINICIGICWHILYICISICSHYLHILLTYVFWCYFAWHKWPFTFQSYVMICWHMLKGVMSQMSAIFWYHVICTDSLVIGAKWRNLCCAYSCKNLTFTVTCLAVLCVKSWPIARAQSSPESTLTIVLSMQAGSACQHCKWNIIVLRYWTFTDTLASVFCFRHIVWQQQHRTIKLLPHSLELHFQTPFIRITFPEADLAVPLHPAKSESESVYKILSFWFPSPDLSNFSCVMNLLTWMFLSSCEIAKYVLCLCQVFSSRFVHIYGQQHHLHNQGLVVFTDTKT